MKGFLIGLAVIMCFTTLGLGIWLGGTPSGRRTWYNWTHGLKKESEQAYMTRKEVEDTCRAMIASYNSDKLIYEQYKDSQVTEQISWANQAKIRANQTASTYNNYILKNSYIWADNVPIDILLELQILI